MDKVLITLRLPKVQADLLIKLYPNSLVSIKHITRKDLIL